MQLLLLRRCYWRFLGRRVVVNPWDPCWWIIPSSRSGFFVFCRALSQQLRIAPPPHDHDHASDLLLFLETAAASILIGP
jgi:hypothetical protein